MEIVTHRQSQNILDTDDSETLLLNTEKNWFGKKGAAAVVWWRS